MKNQICRICALLLVPLMMILNCPLSTFTTGKDLGVDTKIIHNPVEGIKAGKRILLQVEIKDASDIEVVRVYFKNVDAEEFNS